jgi:hypothetical protein
MGLFTADRVFEKGMMRINKSSSTASNSLYPCERRTMSGTWFVNDVRV